MKFKATPDHKGMVVEVRQSDTNLGHALPQANQKLFQIKKVLVPTDFSDCSRKAVRYAVAFAKQFDATLVLLHVMQTYLPIPELGAVDYGAMEAQLRQGGEAELARIKAEVEASGVQVESYLNLGFPFKEIDETAKRLEVDLIVISTHGRSALQQVFMGGTAEQVVRYAPCPVLVVREQEHEFLPS